MKKVFLLVILLLASAFAVSSVENLECQPQKNTDFIQGQTDISCSISPLPPYAPDRVYNINVLFTPPSGITLNEEKTKLVPYLGKNFTVGTSWNVEIEENKEYALDDAFRVEWDDSVSLELEGIEKEEIQTKNNRIELNFTVKTDDSSFCQKMWNQGAPRDWESGEFVTWANFWLKKENCNSFVDIKVNGKELAGAYADENGNVPVYIQLNLSEGTNRLEIIATDPSGNTKKEDIMVRYTPDLIGEYGVYIIAVGIVIFILVIAVIAYWLSRITTASTLKTAFKKKAETEHKNRLEEIKSRKKWLYKSLETLKTKSVNVGLTQEEESKKRAYETELVRINDELYDHPEYLDQLKKRAVKALEDAKNGLPSKDIRKQLDVEGYSEKDVNLIKEHFKKLKEN
ncbi:hypothetical protein K8R43_00070 [archaeon]|nr:hypothetical protein [archaeon]